MKSIKTPHLVGQSEQAPGLKMRENSVLHKALGLTDQVKLHPQALAALAQYHPDPKIQKMASAALGKLSFTLKPPLSSKTY